MEQGADAGDFGVGDVDEEDVGEVGGGGDVQLVDDGVLHEVDGHDLHDAHAERGEERGGGVAGAVEIGEAVAEGGGEMQAGAVEEELEQLRADAAGGAEEDEQDDDEADGEPLADLERSRRASVGDDGEADEDEDGGEDLGEVVARVPGQGGVEEGVVGVFDGAAQDEDGADAADVEQRRQGEEEGGEDAGAEAGEDGAEAGGGGRGGR